MRRFLGFVVVLSVFVPATAYASPILVNGSFETTSGIPNNGELLAGSTAITGWTVTGTSLSNDVIDYLDPPWDVSDGIHAIDLDGRNALGGGIYQAFATAVGETYAVSFDLSGNPDGGPLVKQVRVAVGGFTQDYQFDSSGQSVAALNWQPIAFSFLAVNATTTLSFTSLTPTPNSYGPLIDNVAVNEAPKDLTPVPEPGTLALFGTGALGLLGRARRRRRPVEPAN